MKRTETVKILSFGILLFISSYAQTDKALSAGADSWKALSFLEGTGTANTQGGSAGASSSGSYTFQKELGNHILARHTVDSAACKGPAAYDCEHHDLLYIYQETGDQSLKAIYFDNEGHVIHYGVSTPGPATVIFTSEASAHGPQFRLVYELKGTIMSGKFEIRMPGQNEWKPYLEWSGTKK
jgi:hypothetical protein